MSVSLPAVWRPPPSPAPQGAAWKLLLQHGRGLESVVSGESRGGPHRLRGASAERRQPWAPRCRGNGGFDGLLFAVFPASKSMQEGWGSGGDDGSLGPGQWDDDEGAMWNSAASQDSSSSCSSWGAAPKKGLQKVRPAEGRGGGRGAPGALGTPRRGSAVPGAAPAARPGEAEKCVRQKRPSRCHV